MPVYEYECGACGHQFEEWQKITDEPIKTCPQCNKKKVQKLISQTAFQLKGGGWYKDLYSSSKPGGSNGESKSESSKSESSKSESSKSESNGKAETKSESKGADAGGAKPASSTKDAGGSPKKETKKASASSK